MEDTIEEKIEAITEALEQLRTESANLLLLFKKQIVFERNQYPDLPESVKKQNHIECYREILSEWEVIKTLYSLLVSNVQSVSDIKVEEKTKPIEVILSKLSSIESPFYSHEFQFPFNLTVLLSGIRSVVKSYIKYTSTNFALGSNDVSLNNSTEITSGPINTKNVKNAAKMFEEITEKVAESAIRLKRSGREASLKATTKKESVAEKSKTFALKTDAKQVALRMEDEPDPQKDVANVKQTPPMAAEPQVLLPVIKKPAPYTPKFLRLHINDDNQILRRSTPVCEDEHNNSLLNSPQQFSAPDVPITKSRNHHETTSAATKDAQSFFVHDKDSQIMKSMMMNGDVAIRDEGQENAIEFEPLNGKDITTTWTEDLHDEKSYVGKQTDTENDLKQLGKSWSGDLGYVDELEAEIKDYENEMSARTSEGRSSIRTIIKSRATVRPRQQLQIQSKLENGVVPKHSVPNAMADIESPLSKMLTDESLAMSRMAKNSALESVSSSRTSYYAKKNSLSISKSDGVDSGATDQVLSPGPPPLPTSPKPVKMAIPIPAVRPFVSSQKAPVPIPDSKGEVFSSLDGLFQSKPKKDRPKTLLQELKVLTDNVAKRRQEISSVMYNDRDYIVGIMDVFDEVDEKKDMNDFGSSFFFHPDIDADLDKLDKNERPDHTREIFRAQSLKKIRNPTTVDSNSNPSNEDLRSPINEGSNFLIPFVHELNAELKQKLTVSTAIQKSILNDQSQVTYDPMVSTAGETKDIIQRPISLQPFNPWMAPQKFTQVIIIPLNAMFDIQALDMTETHRFGRNNTTNHPFFKGFPTLVVSRNHADCWENQKKIYIRDIGSSSGTFRNQVRLSPPNQKSAEVEIFTGDYIQFGKDFQDDTPLDQYGRISARKRCVKFQIIIVPPGKTASDVMKDQYISIESPVNRSQDSGSAYMEAAAGAEVPAPQTHTHHSKSAAQTKTLPPPLPQLPEKDKPAASIHPNPSSQSYNQEGSDIQKVAKSYQSRLSASIASDNEFPIKEGFRHKILNDQYVISYSVTSGKVAKLKVSNAANGQLVIDTNLTRWDDKNRITITDYRLVAQRTFDIFLETKPGAKSPAKLKSFSENVPWQITNNSGLFIGCLVFVNDIKMEIVSIEKAVDGAQISITGDFKQKKLLFIKKWPDSREQLRFGECQGKYQTKKSFIDSQWVANVEVESGANSRLLLCGIILSCCLNP